MAHLDLECVQIPKIQICKTMATVTATYLHLVESHAVEVLLWHVDAANLALQAVIRYILLLQSRQVALHMLFSLKIQELV